jgi:hypothetical protein
MAKLCATGGAADPAASGGGMPWGMSCGKARGAAAGFGASDEGPKIEEVYQKPSCEPPACFTLRTLLHRDAFVFIISYYRGILQCHFLYVFC